MLIENLIAGKGLTNFFGKLMTNDFSPSIKDAISEILDLHTMLLQNYPVQLQKQDVVNTSLKWLTNLWSIHGAIDEKELSNDIKKGFEQSLKRKNSIFYIQSMNAYAISLLLRNEISRAFNTFFLVIDLLHREKISMSHEGVKQLFLYVKDKFPKYYMLIKLYYDNSSNIKLFAEKASFYTIDFPKNMNLSLHVQFVQAIVKDYYAPLRKDIFLANTSKIIELL